jgi:signal transduction histidine kinase
MRHGIQLFGPDRRLLAHNALSVTYCGLHPEDVFDGMTFDEAVRRMHRRGVLGPEPGASQAAQERIGRDRSQPYRSRRLAPDGTVIEVFCDPTPDGGFVISLTDITALARAEAAAQEQAATLRAAIDSTRHGIALYGPDRRLRIANRLSGPAHGVAALEERVGDRLEDLIAEQLARGAFGEGEEAVRTAAELSRVDRSKPLRFQRRMASGKVLDIASDPTPDGGFIITHSDVTELVEAKADASTRAGILQVMLDNIRHGITYYGADRRVITSNALAGGLGGHPPGSVAPGRLLDDLIEEQRARGALSGDVAGITEMARTLDRSRPARYVRRNADGRTVEVTSDPTPDGGFVVTMTDISALAEAEAAAKQRASMLQAMLDNIRHGIALFDQDGRVLAANPVFRAMLDLPEAVIAPGRPMADFVTLMLERGEYGEGEAGLAAAQAMLGRDRSRPLRTTRTRPNGMTVETVSDPIPGGGWVITYTDVTEDRRIRAELERAKNAAEAANTAKSRFLATMSHELRTPLNAVIGFSEAYLAAPDPARGLDYMRSIHEAGRHLLSLIDDILDVTRAETSGFAVTTGEVDPRALAEGAVRVMRATAATAGVTLQAVLPPTLPWVRADELRMRQVLLNLLSNAVKFTPAGGLVTLAGEQDGGDLVLRVTDTGIGMRPEDIPRAFEPFTQLDSSLARRFPGSGLGLYLSKALAEAQGAALSLESTPGRGTTAVLRIPQALLMTP